MLQTWGPRILQGVAGTTQTDTWGCAGEGMREDQSGNRKGYERDGFHVKQNWSVCLSDWALHLMTIVRQMFWINSFLTTSLCSLTVCESSKDSVPASLGHHSEQIWGQQMESDWGVWAPRPVVSAPGTLWGYIQTEFLMYFVKTSEEQFCSTLRSCSQFFSSM